MLLVQPHSTEAPRCFGPKNTFQRCLWSGCSDEAANNTFILFTWSRFSQYFGITMCKQCDKVDGLVPGDDPPENHQLISCSSARRDFQLTQDWRHTANVKADSYYSSGDDGKQDRAKRQVGVYIHQLVRESFKYVTLLILLTDSSGGSIFMFIQTLACSWACGNNMDATMMFLFLDSRSDFVQILLLHQNIPNKVNINKKTPLSNLDHSTWAATNNTWIY